MTDKYRVGFVIPRGAARVLTEDGWEFESAERLPQKVETALANALSLRERTPDHSRYETKGLTADVFKDGRGQVENVYLRFCNSRSPVLLMFLKEVDRLDCVEFFTP